MGPADAPGSSVPLSRARRRSSRAILDAARALVEANGLDDLSMRRLADAADVSVRTIYNVFGDKDGLITALVLQSLDAMDEAFAQSSASDPIERVWDTIAISVEANCRYVPAAVVGAVVSDARLQQRVSHRWNGNRLILEAVEGAIASGALRADLTPARLVEQAGPMHAYRLRQWADGAIDEPTLRASVLHGYDVCLLAVARPKARARLLDHVATLEPLLPALIPGFDDVADEATR